MFRTCVYVGAIVVAVASASAQEDPAPSATGSVKRAVFASAIVDREPVDHLDSLTTDVDSIFFFSEIVGMEGQTVKHRWTFGGEVMAEVSFVIGGPRWRVYSCKRLVPGWVGEWTVSVADDSGNALDEKRFVYAAAAQ